MPNAALTKRRLAKPTRRPVAGRRSKADATLPIDIEPMLAALGKLPADDDQFAYEYKWDGVRTLAYLSNGSLQLRTRNQIDSTHRYPELHSLVDALPIKNAILDGEIVALDDVDRPSFSRLQHRMHLNDRVSIERGMRDTPIFLIVFDVLHLNDRSLLHEPYIARREMLEELTLAGPNWQTTNQQVGDGKKMLDAARSLSLEGVIAKRLSSFYEPGRRSPNWIKIKLVQNQEFVIGGWQEQSGTSDRIGALLVGYYEPQVDGSRRLKYAGRVGTGFTASIHSDLLKRMKSLKTATNSFVDRLPKNGPPIHFVKPKLVAQVDFRGWTDALVLRHPSFKGLRADKDACAVIRES